MSTTRSGTQTQRPATLVWIRRELRTADLPALDAAVKRGGPVIPVFVRGPDEEQGGWADGGAARWWLHHSLHALQSATRALGSPLVIRAGDTVSTLRALLQETGADLITFTHRVEPAAVALATRVARELPSEGFDGDLLWTPRDIATKAGNPYRVFTPFSRRCLAAQAPAASLPAPASLFPPASPVTSLPIEALRLLPSVPWDAGLAARWTPGCVEAQRATMAWLTSSAVSHYATGRDRPDLPGTSALSAHLAFGELSPRDAWHAVNGRLAVDGDAATGLLAWRRQLLWREFGRHLLAHYPDTTDAPLDKRYTTFPWRENADFLDRWQRGQTGFPFIDAAQRALWTTGWMHNRARMAVASFLVKDGLISWHAGARWFWDTLVDADLANNTLGWQWAGGCGADAAPFFRIFNPTTQGLRHDAAGTYTRTWVPELAALRNAKDLHDPWKRMPTVAVAAGYARPIVDHADARLRALETWRGTRAPT